MGTRGQAELSRAGRSQVRSLQAGRAARQSVLKPLGAGTAGRDGVCPQGASSGLGLSRGCRRGGTDLARDKESALGLRVWPAAGKARDTGPWQSVLGEITGATRGLGDAEIAEGRSGCWALPWGVARRGDGKAHRGTAFRPRMGLLKGEVRRSEQRCPACERAPGARALRGGQCGWLSLNSSCGSSPCSACLHRRLCQQDRGSCLRTNSQSFS